MREIHDHLEVNNNELYICGLSCVEIADQFGTPTYVYNSKRIVDNYKRLNNSLEKYSDRDIVVYYSVKANFNPHIMQILSDHGAHADVLSTNEAEFALNYGFKRDEIIFTGTSVSDDTIRYLIDRQILINIDSFSQMQRLAKYNQKCLKVSFRWNPGVGVGFDPKTITAGPESHGRPIKFGIQEERILDACKQAVNLGLHPIGLHQHIGSGWIGDDVEQFLMTVDSTLSVAKKMTKLLGYELEQVDFGGGPGIPYQASQKAFPIDVYGRGICRRVIKSDLSFEKICVESGRYIVGDSGILLTRVNTVEEKNGNLIIGVNAGFNTLLRPAFYGHYDENGVFKEAYHEIVVSNRVEGPNNYCTIAGPICETGDLLAVKRLMTRPKEGEVLAILDTGAYGYSMSSNYNLQPRPAEVIVPDTMLSTRREKLEDLIKKYPGQ